MAAMLRLPLIVLKVSKVSRKQVIISKLEEGQREKIRVDQNVLTKFLLHLMIREKEKKIRECFCFCVFNKCASEVLMRAQLAP